MSSCFSCEECLYLTSVGKKIVYCCELFFTASNTCALYIFENEKLAKMRITISASNRGNVENGMSSDFCYNARFSGASSRSGLRKDCPLAVHRAVLAAGFSLSVAGFAVALTIRHPAHRRGSSSTVADNHRRSPRDGAYLVLPKTARGI